MGNYVKITDYAAKDALITGNPAKLVKGAEIGADFDAVAVASATKVDMNGALGTPSSGTVTNLTGTASININGTVGATTPAAGSFTTLGSNSTTTLDGTTIPTSKTLVVTTDIGTSVQAFDADTLKADTADVLTAGYAATPHDAGTKSTGTYTPDEANGNMQYCVNGGAFTLAPPTNNCTMVIQITNNASAGAITTSGFTKVSGSFTTTNGDDFFAYITKLNGFSSLDIKALQ